MNIFKSVFLLSILALFSSSVMASLKIGILDSRLAVYESDIAKKYAKDSEIAFTPKINLIKSLEKELENLQNNLKKNGPTLSKSQLDTIKLNINRKYEDLQLQKRQLSAEKTELDEKEMRKIQPLLEKSIEKIFKNGNYDMILERGVAVHTFKPSYDVTRLVIKELNNLK